MRYNKLNTFSFHSKCTAKIESLALYFLFEFAPGELKNIAFPLKFTTWADRSECSENDIFFIYCKEENECECFKFI